jgi:glycosyltransferase involved in cell wall biosynthesis
MQVYYYAPENDGPSWGVGMIYYHVWLLNKNGIKAHVLHNKRPFKITWLRLDVPIQYLNDRNLNIQRSDYLIIPEVLADKSDLHGFNCKKIVFVQNAFYIYEGLARGKSYKELGFETIFYYMPHLKKILNFITDIPLYETPPFIAPYYFSEKINFNRKKHILLYPKFHNKEYDILKRLIVDKLSIRKKKLITKLFNSDEWEIRELKNKKHHEVPDEMRQAMFFISINNTEAFNSSVPEAMACGCINVCYEGVGPADFLVNDENAFVFPNTRIYEMAEKIIRLVNNYEEEEASLNTMRLKALETAKNYQIDTTEQSLLIFFGDKVG